MVPDPAVGIDTTQAGTRVHTFLQPAHEVGGTVPVENTLRSTVGRATSHAWQAGTVATVSNSSWRVGIGSTGVGITRILLYNRLNN